MRTSIVVASITLVFSITGCSKPSEPLPTSTEFGDLATAYSDLAASFRDRDYHWALDAGTLETHPGPAAPALVAARDCVESSGNGSSLVALDYALQGSTAEPPTGPPASAECLTAFGLSEGDPMASMLTQAGCDVMLACGEALDAAALATRAEDIRSPDHVWSEGWAEGDEDGIGWLHLARALRVRGWLSHPEARATGLADGDLAAARMGVILTQGAPLLTSMVGLGSTSLETLETLLVRDALPDETLERIAAELPVLAATLPSYDQLVRAEALVIGANVAQWSGDDPIGLPPVARAHLALDVPDYEPVPCRRFEPVPNAVFDALGVDPAAHAMPANATSPCAATLQLLFAQLDRNASMAIPERILGTQAAEAVIETSYDGTPMASLVVLFGPGYDARLATLRSRMLVLALGARALVMARGTGEVPTLEALETAGGAVDDPLTGERFHVNVTQDRLVIVSSAANPSHALNPYLADQPTPGVAVLLPAPPPPVVPAGSGDGPPVTEGSGDVPLDGSGAAEGSP